MSESSRSDTASISSRGLQEPTTSIREAGDADAIPTDTISGLDQRPRLVVLDTFEELDDNTGPPIVLVHVAVLCPREKFHSISSLLPESKARRTELLCRVELDDVLVGDLVETVIEQQAIYLLQDLISRSNSQISKPANDSKRKPNTVFALVAYDIGAAIVNMAVWFAAKHPDLFPHIFCRTFTVVFSGCPQRSPDGETGMQRVLSNLLREKTTERQDRQITPLTLHSLARLMIRTAGLFVASKYTLRSRVVSVHAHESALGHIHSSITAFVGSVGTATEILIQEKPGDDERYHSLGSKVTLNYDGSNEPLPASSATPSPEWEDLDDMLLCLAPPHTQHHFQVPFSSSSLDRIRSNAAFIKWRDHGGVQALYIAEASSGSALEVACKLISAGRGDPFRSGEPTLCFDVSFDTYYNDIPSMVASILAHRFAYQGKWRGDRVSEAIRNQHVFRTGWNRKSSLNLFDYYRDVLNHASVLLLQNFDQCRKEDREIFWDYLSELSGRSEWPLKVIVTSTEPNALREEIGSWSIFNAVVDRPIEEQIYEPNNLLRQLPVDAMRASFQTELDRLKEFGTESTGKVLRVLGECSRWPADTSAASLTEFCRLLHIVSNTRSMDEALHGIIMSRTDVRGFSRALSLLVSSHRQLSFRELIFVSLYQEDPRPTEASDYQLGLISIREKAVSNALEQSLQGLVDYHGSHVVLRPGIQRLMSSVDDANICINWKQSSHSDLSGLYLSLMMSESNQDSLRSVADAQGSVLDSSRTLSPNLLLRREMIQYAVQAFPHHLKECPQSTIDRIVAPKSGSVSNALLAWAQAYWAVSSQFKRMSEKPRSHLTILSMLGIGTYEDFRRDISSFVSAVLGSRMVNVEIWLEKGDLSPQDLTDALVTAIQAGHETLALKIAEALVSRHRSRIVWPVTVLRAAVWNNMPELVEVLLRNGVNPNSREDYASIDTDIGYVASPLYIACGLGLVKVFHDLLNAGAKAHETDVGQSNYLSRAARHGNPDIVDAIIKRSLSPQWKRNYPDGLGTAAFYGNWRTCQLLLDESEHSNTSTYQYAASNQKALIKACLYEHAKTARVLLDHGIDPNAADPSSEENPLSLASIFQPDIQMVGDLLLHGADPTVRASGQTILSRLPRNFKGDDDHLLTLCDTLLSNHTSIIINAPDDDGWTALMSASCCGRLAMVNWLIDNGAELDALSDDGTSALSIAVLGGYPDVVRRLLKESPDVDRVSNNGNPLVFRASSHPEILALLLDAGADIEAADRKGRRLIHWAILDEHEHVLKMLLDRKVDVNTPDVRGRPPIYYAVESGAIGMFRLLAQRGAALSDLTGEASLLHAAISSSSDMLRAVLEFRKFLDLEVRNLYDETPLMAARSNTECWTLMINAGAELNAMKRNMWTPLHFAVEPGMANFRSILLSQPDIDIERGGNMGPPLYEACGMMNIEAVRDLLASGAGAHSKPAFASLRRATAIISTIHGSWFKENGDWTERKIELIRLLVSHGCDVRESVPGSLISGALSHACLAATPELVTLLLDEGARADECSSFGRRYPLHYAAANGIGIFKLIYDAYDGDMMVEDVGRRHCLHWAAQSGNAQTIKFILERLKSQNIRVSTYINTFDTDGWSPLCWAIRPFQDYRYFSEEKAEASDFESTVRILLENGADPTIKCRLAVGNQIQDISVLELARRRKAGIAIVNMLKSKIRLDGEGSSEKTEDEVPSAFEATSVCDICFAPEIEPMYTCTDCFDWDSCTKCYRSIRLFHCAKTQNDEKRHSFELPQDGLARFMTQGPQENTIAQGAAIPQEKLDGSDDDESLDFSDEDEPLDLSDDDEI